MTATNLPPGLSIGLTNNGLAASFAITGLPTQTNAYLVGITLTDINDNSVATNSLQISVFSNGAVIVPIGAPLAITSTNQYSGANVTHSNRPPFLARAATTNNSFTMRYYYENQAAFDWPGLASAPAVGAIVPYLLPPNPGGGFTLANTTNKFAQSLDIVFRPVWPSIVNQQPVPTLYSGQTLTTPMNNLAAVRGQGSAQVLYQQSIATNNITQPVQYQSVTLLDPTV